MCSAYVSNLDWLSVQTQQIGLSLSMSNPVSM